MNSRKQYNIRVLSILKRTFDSSGLSRKSPVVSSLHRVVDGALFGVMISGALMTSLALHSQHLWTVNFSRLNFTRDLIHRLEESTPLLERYLISSVSSPTSIVATKSAHLIYIQRPYKQRKSFTSFLEILRNSMSPLFYPITNGY